MIGGKNQGAVKPTALGSLLQASTYGATIPVIYGQTQSPMLAIWSANLRQGGSTKKFKQMKKGLTSYVENVDFLLGHNPIMGVLQMWVNGGLYPLTFTSQVVSGVGPEFEISDAHFYAVIAITIEQSYSVTFNDYGGQGSQTLSGTYEVPLWNQLELGPDPTAGSGFRNYPFCYRWQPSYGATFYIDAYAPLVMSGAVKVYYAQLMDATSFLPPIQKLKLAFEGQLGSGDEYDGFSRQQIIYPQFAGMGSPDIDLGSSGAIPQLQAEVRGKWGLYPGGDGDFADMIEDIFKSGVAQAAIGADTAYSQLERGLSSYNLPGLIQKQVQGGLEIGDVKPMAYKMPVTEGNFLVALANISGIGGGTFTISDTLGNTWTPLLGSGTNCQVWWAQANASGANTVTVTGFGTDWGFSLMEIAGVDTFDSAVVSSTPSLGLTTTNQQNFPGYLVALAIYQGTTPSSPSIEQWNAAISTPQLNGNQWGTSIVFDRRINSPRTFSLTLPGSPAQVCLLAFKCVNPAPHPKPVGDFIDLPSLDLVRKQCRANGLWGSLTMTSQSAASDWLKQLYQAANAAPVFMGSKLFSFPYSEVSTVGNGAIYAAPTASGPVADLDADNGDFVGSSQPITVKTASRVNMPNVLQMQCFSRSANYNQVVVSQPDAASIALYGQRKADPIVNNAVQDQSIARQLLAIQVRRNQYGGDVYSFRINSKWSLLRPMNLVLITDRLVGVVKFPVRITSMAEQDDGSQACDAEPFVYGMCAPTALSTTAPSQNLPNTTQSAGDVNAPIILEPVPRLYAVQNQAQLWVLVSSSSTQYGGCQVYISTDGGSSYNPAGDPLIGGAITGVTTADWPTATDPDTTNDLAIDLTESNGTLQSYQTSDEDNFLYPCYVASGGAFTIPYELMTYAIATMTAVNKYTLKATGTGSKLRRGVFGAPSAGTGVDHPSGSRWAFLAPSGAGILKLNMDPTWIGKTLHFKIVSFNTFGGSAQSLSDVTAYTYMPSGAGASGMPAQGFQINGA